MARRKEEYFKMQTGAINKNLNEGRNDFCVSRNLNIWSSVEVRFPEGYIYNRLTPTDKRVFQAVGTLYKKDMLDLDKDEKNKYIYTLSEITEMCGFSAKQQKNLERVRHSLNKLKVTLVSINLQEEVEKIHNKDYSGFQPRFEAGTCTVTDSCIDWQEYKFNWHGETKIKYVIKNTPILFAYNDVWNTISNEPIQLIQSNYSDDVQIALTEYILERVRQYSHKYKESLNLIKIDALTKHVEKEAAKEIAKAHFSRFVKRIVEYFNKLKEVKKIDDFKIIKEKKKITAIKFEVNKLNEKEKTDKKIKSSVLRYRN